MARGEGEAIRLENLHAWYGESHVLQGVDLTVRRGEVVTLLGRNGAGKTTTLRSIMGLVEKRRGRIEIGGRDSISMLPEDIANLGLGFCPEERGIFTSLTVEENLRLPPVLRQGGMSFEELFELFPNLADRLRNPGARLSGGEQQMLAIARILRMGSQTLLLDEPTEGLAPVIIDQIVHIVKRLRERKFTILLVEQNLSICERLADRHYIMEGGRIVDEILTAEIDHRRGQIQAYLGV